MVRHISAFIRRLGVILRRHQFLSCGSNFVFDPFSTFSNPKKISVGHDVFIGAEARFSICQDLKIGDGVLFGPRVTIMTGNHKFHEVGLRIHESPRGIAESVVIEDDVWIGACCVILAGATIREGCVIGAGSVVTRGIIPPYVIAAGVPCRPIRPRFCMDELRMHLLKVDSNLTSREVFRSYQGVCHPMPYKNCENKK